MSETRTLSGLTPGGAPPGLIRGGAASRRQFLRALAAAGGAAGAAAALAGCGGTAEAAGTTVRFWTLLAGPDGLLLQDLLDQVEDETGFRVDPVTLAWGSPYYTKLAMAAAGGRAPELGVLHLSRLQGYAPGGLLDPWDMDLMAELGVREQDFPEALWGRTGVGGETLAVPLDTHPFILFLNTDHLATAGLTAEQVAGVTDPAEFLEVGRALADASGDLGFAWSVINDGANIWRLFYTFYAQHGQEISLEPGTQVQIDRDIARESLGYIQQLITEVGTPGADISAAISAFQGGRAGGLFNGEWELRGMVEAEVPFDAVPIPTLFGTPAAYADSHSLVLPHQADPDPAVRRATHEVVASMLLNSITWAEAGHIPAYTPVVESPEYGEFEIQPHYAAAAENVVLDPEVWFTGAGSDFQNRVGQAMLSAIGGGDVDAALDRMEAETQRLLDLPAPE